MQARRWYKVKLMYEAFGLKNVQHDPCFLLHVPVTCKTQGNYN